MNFEHVMGYVICLEKIRIWSSSRWWGPAFFLVRYTLQHISGIVVGVLSGFFGLGQNFLTKVIVAAKNEDRVYVIKYLRLAKANRVSDLWADNHRRWVETLKGELNKFDRFTHITPIKVAKINFFTSFIINNQKPFIISERSDVFDSSFTVSKNLDSIIYA